MTKYPIACSVIFCFIIAPFQLLLRFFVLALTDRHCKELIDIYGVWKCKVVPLRKDENLSFVIPPDSVWPDGSGDLPLWRVQMRTRKGSSWSLNTIQFWLLLPRSWLFVVGSALLHNEMWEFLSDRLPAPKISQRPYRPPCAVQAGRTFHKCYNKSSSTARPWGASRYEVRIRGGKKEMEKRMDVVREVTCIS